MIGAEASGDKVYVHFNHTTRLDIRHPGGFELSAAPCNWSFPANSTAAWHPVPIVAVSHASLKVQKSLPTLTLEADLNVILFLYLCLSRAHRLCPPLAQGSRPRRRSPGPMPQVQLVACPVHACAGRE